MKKVLLGLTLLTTIALAAEVKEGIGLGYTDDIKVAVTMEGDQITAIEVVEHHDTPDISEPAFEKLIPAIIEAQSTEIDMIAGATYSSEGLLEAVNVATGK